MVLIWWFEKQAAKLGISDAVVFTGMIPPNETALYYKAADFFYFSFNEWDARLAAYLESIASGTPIIAHGNLSDHVIDDPMFGKPFMKRAI